ncbi:hypothetical protein K469DRAFT_692854 [Zopfia rhizophila CBS 207.26]|uniref:Uncharacterized protein n=1 Tax=Zopfia rhizophila CBS 207.26 TaxID=1314779 RepID=A0A6A6DLI2_9PEZI|nr:hypothetical protein K469DRAFT_692854 [Zopfia rhizophila CBS 207.26]
MAYALCGVQISPRDSRSRPVLPSQAETTTDSGLCEPVCQVGRSLSIINDQPAQARIRGAELGEEVRGRPYCGRSDTFAAANRAGTGCGIRVGEECDVPLPHCVRGGQDGASSSACGVLEPADAENAERSSLLGIMGSSAAVSITKLSAIHSTDQPSKPQGCPRPASNRLHLRRDSSPISPDPSDYLKLCWLGDIWCVSPPQTLFTTDMVQHQQSYTITAAPASSIRHVQIVSSSHSTMAPSRPHAPSSHARLHKRGNSASSITSPLNPLTDAAAFAFNRSETPKVTYEEPWTEPARPMPAATSSNPLKIKPYLRKLSSKDNNALDLSRPAAENEGLTGLGISDHSGNPRSVSEVSFSPMNSRHRHHRSTSNTSQFSTSSSLQRPTAPYMPSIRQTPLPYTPPISKSTPSSIVGSENEADDIMTEEEFRLRQNMFDPARRSGSVSSQPGTSPALRLHTTGSSTRLGSYSQTSLSLTSPPMQSRSRGDTLKSTDTTSPSSRTSFDKAFGFIRGGRDSPVVDPASRAASIRAARQAFNEKEGAKERKYEKEASKQAEKEHLKQYKKEERQRRKSDAQERKEHKFSGSVSNEKMNPLGGRQYSDHRKAHSLSLPAHVVSVDQEKGNGAAPHVTKSRAVKGRWLRFVTWFKTRLLRIGRKLHVSS